MAGRQTIVSSGKDFLVAPKRPGQNSDAISSLYKKLILIAGLHFTVFPIFGQDTNTLVIKAGEDITVINKEIYRYPQFTRGKAYFKNGDSASGMINYNLVIGKMQFIDPNNDTLALANENSISLIVIGGDKFYYHGGEFLELICVSATGKLTLGRRIKLMDEQKIGAFGIPSSTTTIEDNNTMSDVGASYKLKLNKDLILAKETRYYYSDLRRDFFLLNKKSVLKAFTKQRKAVENYFDKNAVDFRNGEDLRALFFYLMAL